MSSAASGRSCGCPARGLPAPLSRLVRDQNPARRRSPTCSSRASRSFSTALRVAFTRDELGAIVDLQVARLIGRVSERGVEVELTDEARTLLGDMGYDPTYGARPLKRVIQKQLVDKLALRLLEGEFAPGDTVRVDAADGQLVFEKMAARVEPVAADAAVA